MRKRHSTDTNTEMNQMLELPDKDFKGDIIKPSTDQYQAFLKQTKNEEISTRK